LTGFDRFSTVVSLVVTLLVTLPGDAARRTERP
jgi:hypothetical protein